MNRLASAIDTLAEAVAKLEAVAADRRLGETTPIAVENTPPEPTIAEASDRLGAVIGKLRAALER